MVNLLIPYRRPLESLTRLLLMGTALVALPTAAMAQTTSPIISSPVSGVVFQDAPSLLPVDTRFSQAVQTVAIDLGLVCEQVESYGWTITPDQQDRVNTIFTQTAEELARLGYHVTPQSPSSAAADITVYTASRADKNVIFMWSAGTTGLLLLTCDARGDVAPKGFGPGASAMNAASASGKTAYTDVSKPQTLSPDELVGEWTGTYSCLGQGPTGATLTVSRAKADKNGASVSGLFSFYPLKDKNPNQPRGSYRFSGRYDDKAQRAILEPGAWVQHPGDYYNAVMAAQFNATQRRVSVVFEGTTGCTSFEGSYKDGSADRAAAKYAPEDDMPKKKRVVKKKPAPAAPAPAVTNEVPADIAPVPSADLAPTVEPTAPAAEATAPITSSSDTAAVTEAPAAAPTPVTVPEKPPVL